MRATRMLYTTKHGEYNLTELMVNGMTFILVQGNTIENLLITEQIGEKTVKLQSDILVDMYAVGTYHEYIKMLEETLFGE